MCHHLTWEDWEHLDDAERRAYEEPRVTEVAEEPEPVEAEPEREPDRELVHA